MTNIIVLFFIYYARMNAIETNYKLLCAGIKYRQDEHVIQLHIFIPWHALKEESTPRRIGQSDWIFAHFSKSRTEWIPVPLHP